MCFKNWKHPMTSIYKIGEHLMQCWANFLCLNKYLATTLDGNQIEDILWVTMKWNWYQKNMCYLLKILFLKAQLTYAFTY